MSDPASAPADQLSLPDLLVCQDGHPVLQAEDWPARRAEVAQAILPLVFGGLPPTPAETSGTLLHEWTWHRLGNAPVETWLVRTGPAHPVQFTLNLHRPPGPGPFPVVLNGDGCWRYATTEVVAEVLSRGYLFAQFNRVEIAPDHPAAPRAAGLPAHFPDAPWGALSAWAWGYHRAIDVLTRHPAVDSTKIGVVGHSRGGKTTLLAGATDPRIALTGANGSGCGGAGCFRHRGPHAEALADILRTFPYWFSPGLTGWIGREAEMSCDLHFLKALLAPRALLVTEALGDLWANPSGTALTQRAARPVYDLLGATHRLALTYRPGDHAHTPEDWRAFLDFADHCWKNQPPTRDFHQDPWRASGSNR